MADSFDLQGLLSRFNQGPSDDEKRRALTQALASAGFGILGARGVNGMQAIGQGGLLGMNAYNGALDDASKSRRAALSDANSAMGLQENMQKMQDADTLRKLQGQFAAQFGAPGANAGQAPAAPAGPVQPPQMGGGSAASLMQSAVGGAPAAPIAPPSAAPQAAPQSGVPDKRALASMYQKQGDWWMQNGQPAKAQGFYDLAQKAMPQIKETRNSTQNGRRVLVNFYTDGSHEVVPDVGPDAEKAVMLDTGKTIGAVDPFTGQPIAGGGLYNKAMTPGETATNNIAQANLAIARSREARESANNNPNKPTFDATAGQFVYPPSTDNPTGKAVTPLGFTKPDKPLTEQQGNAMMFGGRMQQANGIINGLASKMNVTSPMNALAGNGVTNVFASDNAQKLEQAKRNFMTAGLRKESGASISKSEYDMYDKTYFPQIGDSQAVLKQKSDLRDQAIAGMMQVAGTKGAQQANGGWTVKRIN